MRYIPLTLDNLVYDLIIKEEEDITFILPHKTPSFSAVNKNKFIPANEVEIKVYVSTNVEPLPKVVFVGQDDNSKIVTNGSFELLPNSLMVITFSTTNGGATWLVNSCSANGATAEGAETIAKNAESVAVEASKSAETAVTTAETAANTAKDAQGKAETAVTTAGNAVSVAGTAVNMASEAQKAAASAADVANEASRRSVDAENNVTQLGETVETFNESISTAQETAENAQSTADNAQKAATNAGSVAEKAQTAADDASKAAGNAQTTADNALEKANNSLQLTSETEYQKIETGLVLGKAKKLLLERANGGTPLGMAMNQYNELTDKATGAGLEQVEIGTPQAIMCLNHCGAEFTDANGETKVVDGHIRVDYKEKAGAPTQQDQLAYMSDIKKIQEQLETININLKTIVEHIKNAENALFWIDPKTYKPTRDNVDPDTLTPLPTID